MLKALVSPVHILLHAVRHSDFNYCTLNTALLIRLLHCSRDYAGLQRYFDIVVIILVTAININILRLIYFAYFPIEPRIAKWAQ